jgi:hypothetical protein
MSSINASITNLSSLVSNLNITNTGINLSGKNISNVGIIQTVSILDLSYSTGTIGQVLSKNVSNNMVWETLIPVTTPTLSQVLTAGSIANKTIDMNGHDISGCLNLNVVNINTNTSININGQVIFDTPPHVPNPLYGNDVASKGYVDSLVGQYSGGLNMFFNKSQSSYNVSESVLSLEVSSSSQQNVSKTSSNTSVGSPILITTFVSTRLGITTIPAGIWNATIYGKTDKVNTQAYYFYKLYTRNVSDQDTLISTSSDSSIINTSTSIGTYHCNATIETPITLVLTDRVVINLYFKKEGNEDATTITTYFENSYYSFVQSTLNAGTTLLSSNNNWTGTNNFDLAITTPSINAPSIQVESINISGSTLNVGVTGKSINLKGNVDIPTLLTFNNGSYTLYGGSAYSTTNVSYNIGLNVTNPNINFIMFMTGSQPNQTITLPLAKEGNSIYLVNQSYYTWTIQKTSSDQIIGGICGTAGASSFILQPNKVVCLSQTTGFHIWVNETISNTTNEVLKLVTGNIDSNSTALTIGGTTATSVVIGKASQTTNLLGNLQINSSAGSDGQVLTSNGTLASWQNIITGWVGTATSNLSMGPYSIIGSTIDSSNTLLTIGNTNATSITIGNINTNTSIFGKLNVSNISTQYINSINTSLYIGSNTSLIQIGNTNSNTSVLGTLNISVLTINGSYGTNEQVLTTNGNGLYWTTTTNMNTNASLSSVLSNGSSAGNNGINMNNQNITNVGRINVSYIDSINSSLYIGSNASTIQIGNNGIDSTNSNTSLINTSSPIYLWGGGSSTGTFYNTNASIYYNINNDIITNSNGGFFLWYSWTSTNGWNGLRIFNKLDAQNQYIKNASGNIDYYYVFSNIAQQDALTNGGNTGANTGNFYVIYNNVSYSSTKTNGEFDYDTTGNIIIKINGVQVPLYITTIESFVPIFTGLNWQVFVNYNSDGTIVKNANSSVNYYAYNPQSLHLELIDSGTLNTATGMKKVNGNNVYNNTGTWNASGEILFTDNVIPPTNDTYYNYYVYPQNNVNTYVLGILNASNIGTQYINSLNSSLYIGSNTSLIQIGNSNSNTKTSVLGTLNISLLQINGSTGTNGQVITSNGTLASWQNIITGWVGTATSNLSMGSYSIIGSTIDASNTALTIGGTTATSIILGKASQTTNLLGNFQVNSSAGSSGQVLTSNGTLASWQTPTSGWTGTATSNLSMGIYNINFSNASSNSIDITATNITINDNNVGNNHRSVLNDGNLNLYVQNNNVVSINAASMSICQIGVSNAVTTISYSQIRTQTSTGTYIAITPTDITVTGNAGTAGQVLSKNDSNVLTWANTTNGWNGTATSNLSMGTYSIIGSTIDSSNTLLTIGGTNATSITIGNVSSNTSIFGNLNTSNISTQYINSLNTSLYIGSNTSLIQIGNTNSNTSILGILNISALTINGSYGTNGQVLTTNSNGISWTTISAGTNTNLSFVLSNGSSAGLNGINMNNKNINNVGLINVSYIDSNNNILNIGRTNVSNIQIGNNIVDSTNSNTSLLNGSSPIYSWTGNSGVGGVSTGTFYNTNVSIYYNINDNKIGSNGGFFLWYSYTSQVVESLSGLRIFKKVNAQNQNISNASGNVAYYYYNSLGTPIMKETLSVNGNSGNFYVIYNNVSYSSTKTNGEFDYDTTGNIIIKINGVQVPLYITTIESSVPLFTNFYWQVFVNYNSDGTIVKNANSSVNYYAYNPKSLHLELISSSSLNTPSSIYKVVNETTDYVSLGTWNASGELLFTNNVTPATNDTYYNYYVYTPPSVKTSIFGILNSSNISTQYVNSLNSSLYIGANTSLIEIGNRNSNTTTSVLGKLNISLLQINGSTGTNGQVLTSNGTLASWQPTSWVGTATSNLSMGSYSIIGSTIDASNTALTIGGTSATSLVLGKASQTTNVLGNFQVNSSAGSNGQVLTSNGTTAIWQTLSAGPTGPTGPSGPTGATGPSAWVGTATSDLNLNNFKINVVQTTIPAANIQTISSRWDFTQNAITSITTSHQTIATSNVPIPIGSYIAYFRPRILASPNPSTISYITLSISSAINGASEIQRTSILGGIINGGNQVCEPAFTTVIQISTATSIYANIRGLGTNTLTIGGLFCYLTKIF